MRQITDARISKVFFLAATAPKNILQKYEVLFSRFDDISGIFGIANVHKMEFLSNLEKLRRVLKCDKLRHGIPENKKWPKIRIREKDSRRFIHVHDSYIRGLYRFGSHHSMV